MKLDGISSPSEVARVGRNGFDTAVAWAHGLACSINATSAPGASRLAWLGLNASRGEAKLAVATILSLLSEIHQNGAFPWWGVVVVSTCSCRALVQAYPSSEGSASPHCCRLVRVCVCAVLGNDES